MALQFETVLIALDYLLNQTDEKHLSSETKINAYALETYGVSIDRRCLKTTLEKIKNISDKYPEKLPFVLKDNGKERPRYYIEQKDFSRDEIISIATAIKDTFHLDCNTSLSLIKRFIKITTNVHQRAELLDIVLSQPEKSSKITPNTYNTLQKIQQAINEKHQVTYTFKGSKKQRTYEEYFYKIVYFGVNPVAISFREGALVSHYVKDIKILKVGRGYYYYSDDQFSLDSLYKGRYKSADEEIKKTFIPNPSDSFLADLEFNFSNTDYILRTIQRAYYDAFHTNLKYDVIGKKCYVKIQGHKSDILLDWVVQHKVASLIRVTGNEKMLIALELYYKKLIKRNNLDKFNI